MILSALRQAYPSLPVILMTGFGSEDVAVEAFRRGVRDYLKKPINPRDLVIQIEAHLAAHQQSDKPAPSLGWKVDRPPPVGDRATHDAGLQRAIAFIEGQLHTELRLDQVAREAGMSRFHFCRHFKEATGLTFREFLARRRIARAVVLLHDRTRSVSEVYLDVGFKNPSHFSRVFLKLTGQSPSRYRRTTEESR